MKDKILPDSLFNRLCSSINNCFFVQIGANNGIENDPIHHLIKKNKWSGILVEPGIVSFQELKNNYKDHDNLIFELAAISDVDGEVDLYCGTTGQHFTLNYKQAERMFDVTPEARRVKSLTPLSLLKKHNVQKVDILQIDVEGYDFDILQNFPFDKFLPEVIRYEFIHFENSIERSLAFFSKLPYECYFSEDGQDIIAIKMN